MRACIDLMRRMCSICPSYVWFYSCSGLSKSFRIVRKTYMQVFPGFVIRRAADVLPCCPVLFYLFGSFFCCSWTNKWWRRWWWWYFVPPECCVCTRVWRPATRRQTPIRKWVYTSSILMSLTPDTDWYDRRLSTGTRKLLLLLLWATSWTITTTTVLRPFFRNHPGVPVPEENFWSLWYKKALTEADTPTVRLGATPSGLTSAHLHHPPIFYRPDALPAAQPTVSKHWRQLAHSG